MVMVTDIPEETTKAYPIVVYDDMGPFSVIGRKIAEVSWTYEEARRHGYDQWTDIRLISVPDKPALKYYVQIVGRSSVYHRDGGPCSRGVSMLVGQVSQDEDRYDALNPCQLPGCSPEALEVLDDEDSIRVEVELYTLYKCRDAAGVVAALYGHDRRPGRTPSRLSAKILQAASLVDKDIENALMLVPRD